MRARLLARRLPLALIGVALGSLPAPVSALVALDATFDADAQGFAYQDDLFRGTARPGYASGAFDAAGGESGGGLRVDLGGVDEVDVDGMSGGFVASFEVTVEEPLEVRVRWRLSQSPHYESDEASQLLVAVDGALVGAGGADFVAEVAGNGNGGAAVTTGWRGFRADLGVLAPGLHTIAVGGWNERKTTADETTEIRLDDVVVETAEPPLPRAAAQALVASLDAARFRANVETLASFGTRYWSRPENQQAVDWIEAELAAYGYAVERHAYTYQGATRHNVYATKVGRTQPDRMYIVSGHMDSYNTQSAGSVFAPGANDDASGTSLVLELARVFAPAEVETDVSVRFVLWNNEETGLDGSAAYVAARRALQGVESPPGSGQYPEPTWLGVIQHDMILFDHGLPPQPQQIAGADIDVEYQASATSNGGAIDLALALHGANARYAAAYPAEVSTNMDFTDSRSFQLDAPSVSVRENRRVAEIGQGADPQWHKNSDVVATYSDADFALGFDTVRTTAGAVAELAGAQLPCSNGRDDDGDGAVDHPADFDCLSPADRSEIPDCADGIDGDRDGATDFPADPGCRTADNQREDPACSDGLDNDADGAIDWNGSGAAPPDPECAGLVHRDREWPRGCGLGAELLLVLAGLARLRRDTSG